MRTRVKSESTLELARLSHGNTKRKKREMQVEDEREDVAKYREEFPSSKKRRNTASEMT